LTYPTFKLLPYQTSAAEEQARREPTMSVAKLYSSDITPRGRSIRVVAKYEGIDLELVSANPWTNEGIDETYLKKFPYGKVPAYEKGNFYLSECIAILWYLAKQNNKAGLLGKTPEEEALVHQWTLWGNMEFMAGYAAWQRPLRGLTSYNKGASQDAEAKAHKCAQLLNDHLQTRTFIVGDRITIADIFNAAVFGQGAELVFDKEFRSKYPNVVRHFHTVANQPEYLAAIPKPYNLIEVRPTYTAPKKEKEAAKTPAAPKPAAAPKAEKKAAKEKEVDEEDDGEPKPEPKAKHPCEALGPAASFPLDEWKRQYSNNDTKDAMIWLEKHYNPQDYSIWKVVFKYPEELTQVFMSSNLITGFHNRLEGSRKFLFGSAGVYGVANNNKIQGAYMVRGADYKPVFEVAPDYESYEFSPLDLTKDREFIEGCWAWTNEMDGLKYADGKVFK